MTDELARRIGVWLTATKNWKPGMRISHPAGWAARSYSDGDELRWADEGAGTCGDCGYTLGDIVLVDVRINFTDGATRGALEDILRERWPEMVTDGEEVYRGWDSLDNVFTLARAIVAAYDIEEAP